MPFLTTKSGPRGFLVLLFCAQTLKSLSDKRGNHFFSVPDVWKQSSVLFFYSEPLWAKQIGLVLREEETVP